MHGVAAVEGDGLELDADLVAEPVEVLNRFVGDAAGKGRVGEAAARFDDVGVEEVGRILDAGLFLHVGAGSGNSAAVDDGVAARNRHLVDDEDLVGRHAELAGFKRGGEAGKTRADDHEFLRFVPGDVLRFLGGNGLHEREGTDGGSRGGAEELAAGNISGHFLFSFLKCVQGLEELGDAWRSLMRFQRRVSHP